MKIIILKNSNIVYLLCGLAFGINSFAFDLSKEIYDNKDLTAEQIASLVTFGHTEPSEEEAAFFSSVDTYCMNITQLGGLHNFTKKILSPIEIKSKEKKETIKKYYTTPYCEPQKIGGTGSPIVHLIAENPTERNAYLIELKNYYEKNNEITAFIEILKSKNTRGQTLLDYIYYLYQKKSYRLVEEAPVNELIHFLCENGADFSKYPKSCPVEYLKISN